MQSAAPDEAEVTNLNEIIVTARRIEESLQNVPMTVTALTDRQLKDLNLFNGSDLAAVVPGLTFAPRPGSSTPVVALRGAARGEAGGRQDPTVQTYLNEAPVSDVMVYQALYDIGQVEVLRGPQGTLRGRPASSGAITFTTKRPDLDRITGYVSLAGSTLDQYRGEGAVSVPIITDVLAARLAGLDDDNDNDGVRSLFGSRKPYGKNKSWRASVRYKPIAKLEVNVLYQDFKSDRGTWLQVAGTGYQGPSTPPAGVAAVPANFNGPAISPFDRQSVISTIGIRNEHHQNLIGEFDLDLGSYHLGYVGQYTKTRNRNNGSGDVGHVDPIALPGLQSLDGRSVLRTHELRVETTGDRFWDYGAGLYYESTNSQNLVESFATFLPGTWGNPRGARSLANFNLNYNLILTGNFPTSWENKAIYANSTWHLTPRTELFAGLRYINYTQSSDQIGTLSSGLTATGLPVAFCGLIPSQGAGPAFPSTIIPGQCDVALPARTLFTSNPLVGSFKPSVYSASLTHHFTDDLTAYVSYGHSWRAGTNNLNLSSTDPRIVAFFTTRPETSENYEAGVKTQLLDRKLTLNVAAFYQVYKDYQYSSLGVPYINNTGAALSVATAASLAVNADGKVQGIDFELAYQPNRHFSISGSFNYARGRLSNALVPCNDSNFDGIPDSGVATVAGFQAAGAAVAYCRSSDALARQADWNASVQSEYNMPVSGNTDAYIRALGTYTPSTPFAPTGLTTDSYALINLYLGARGHDGRWDVGGYARNLTNTEKLLTQGASPIGTPADAQTALGLASSTGYRIVSVTPRREFGVTLRYSW